MKQYYLWLVLTFGAGNPLITDLLGKLENPKAVYDAIHSNSIAIGDSNHTLAEKTPIEEAEKMIFTLEEKGFSIITLDDRRYPEQLRKIDNPPCLLFAAGNAELLTKKLVSTAGSRAVTNYTLSVQNRICRELSEDYVLVSSLSGGCDTMTCLCAIKDGTSFIEVLPCGFDYEYPRDSRVLRYQLLAQGGCVITEYPPFVKPSPPCFVRRSRIIGGISGALLVFQAGIDSGALLPVNYSPAPFFLPPHDVFAKEYAGAVAAVRAGAALYYDKSDIDEAFNENYTPVKIHLERRQTKSITPKIAKHKRTGNAKENDEKTEKEVKKKHEDFQFTSDLQATIYKRLAEIGEPTTVDGLIGSLDCEMSDLYETLLDMELLGAVEACAGNRFAAVL